MRISVMLLSKFWEKVRVGRETWCDRREGERKKIVAILLSKLGERKNLQLWQFSCRNMKERVKRNSTTWMLKFRKFWGPQGERISGGRRENLVKIGFGCFQKQNLFIWTTWLGQALLLVMKATNIYSKC